MVYRSVYNSKLGSKRRLVKMRTETEIREKLKEIDDDGWRTGDILKSSVTHYLIETRLLKWVLEEYEYQTKEEIKNIMMNIIIQEGESNDEKILRRAKEAEKAYRDGDVKIGNLEDFWKDMNEYYTNCKN